jgi:hypothetical protein
LKRAKKRHLQKLNRRKLASFLDEKGLPRKRKKGFPEKVKEKSQPPKRLKKKSIPKS